MKLTTTVGIYRIVGDIEVKILPSGTSVGSFTGVNSSKYKTKDGQEREETNFITIKMFGKQAEIVDKYFQDKSRIFVTGDLIQESWATSDGQKRSKHIIKMKEFDFIDSAKDSQPPKQQGYQVEHQYPAQQPQKPVYQAPTNMPQMDVIPDELPF